MKKVNVINKSTEYAWEGDNRVKVPRYQPLDIDGEVFQFKKCVKYECLKQVIPVIVDFRQILDRSYFNQ